MAPSDRNRIRQRDYAQMRFVSNGAGYKFETGSKARPSGISFWQAWGRYTWTSMLFTGRMKYGVKENTTAFEDHNSKLKHDENLLPGFWKGLGITFLKLITNPAAIVSGLLAGLHFVVHSASSWLEKKSTFIKGQEYTAGQKFGKYVAASVNWLIVKRLRLLTFGAAFLWSHTIGALGNIVNRFHLQALALDKKGKKEKRHWFKRGLYGVSSLVLAYGSILMLGIAPLWSKIGNFAPFKAVTNWVTYLTKKVHHLGKWLDKEVSNKHLAGRDTESGLSAAGMYSVKKAGLVLKNGAVAIVASAVIGLTNVFKGFVDWAKGRKRKSRQNRITGGGGKAADVVTVNPAAQRPPSPTGSDSEDEGTTEWVADDTTDEKSTNRLIESFDKECRALKEIWRESKGWFFTRLLFNPAKIIGLVIGSINKALVSTSESNFCQNYRMGMVLNFLIVSRLQFFTQIVHGIWNFFGSQITKTIDNCFDYAAREYTEKEEKVPMWKRVGMGMLGGLLGLTTWFMAVAPYIGALGGFIKVVSSPLTKLGGFIHNTIGGITGFSKADSILRAVGLYTFKAVGIAIQATAKFTWGFVFGGLLARAANALGFKKAAARDDGTPGTVDSIDVGRDSDSSRGPTPTGPAAEGQTVAFNNTHAPRGQDPAQAQGLLRRSSGDGSGGEQNGASSHPTAQGVYIPGSIFVPMVKPGKVAAGAQGLTDGPF